MKTLRFEGADSSLPQTALDVCALHRLRKSSAGPPKGKAFAICGKTRLDRCFEGARL
jgi:hypothetical protein